MSAPTPTPTDQDKDKPKVTVKTVKGQPQNQITEEIKKAAPKLPTTGDELSDKLALAAGVSMMNDFQKSLFPYMVDNIKQFVESEEVTLDDSNNTVVTRAKLKLKDSMQIDRWDMGEDIPEKIPFPHTAYTWVLFQKMRLNYGFTEDLFWDTPLEQMEFLLQLSILKRQGFRRDKPRSK